MLSLSSWGCSSACSSAPDTALLFGFLEAAAGCSVTHLKHTHTVTRMDCKDAWSWQHMWHPRQPVCFAIQDVFVCVCWGLFVLHKSPMLCHLPFSMANNLLPVSHCQRNDSEQQHHGLDCSTADQQRGRERWMQQLVRNQKAALRNTAEMNLYWVRTLIFACYYICTCITQRTWTLSIFSFKNLKLRFFRFIKYHLQSQTLLASTQADVHDNEKIKVVPSLFIRKQSSDCSSHNTDSTVISVAFWV